MPRPKGSKNKPSLAKKKDKEKVLENLALTHGIIAPAIKPLGINRFTLNSWIENDPEFAKKFYEIKEATLDMIESKLIEAANKGNIQALIFMARSLLSSRGYRTSETDVTINNQSIIFQIGQGQIPNQLEEQPILKLKDNDEPKNN